MIQAQIYDKTKLSDKKGEATQQCERYIDKERKETKGPRIDRKRPEMCPFKIKKCKENIE